MEKKRSVGVTMLGILDLTLIIYAIIYIFSWKLFLDLEYFSFLKPYAIIYIFSAFICLTLSRIKKQIAFYSFFVGSIFGPLGIIMILFSAPDLRNLKRSGMKQEFYKQIKIDIEKLRNKIFKYEKTVVSEAFFLNFRRWILYNRLQYLAASIGIKLSFPFNILWSDYKVFLSKLQDIEDAVKKEERLSDK